MRVRPMTSADADALCDLAPQLPGNVDARAELAKTHTLAWVIVDPSSARPLGHVICSHVLDEVELLILAVRPEARGKGGGKALLAQAIAAARASGAARITLEVARGNSVARRLYERAGFVVFNIRRRYYRETGDDALEMELVL